MLKKEEIIGAWSSLTNTTIYIMIVGIFARKSVIIPSGHCFVEIKVLGSSLQLRTQATWSEPPYSTIMVFVYIPGEKANNIRASGPLIGLPFIDDFFSLSLSNRQRGKSKRWQRKQEIPIPRPDWIFPELIVAFLYLFESRLNKYRLEEFNTCPLFGMVPSTKPFSHLFFLSLSVSEVNNIAWCCFL